MAELVETCEQRFGSLYGKKVLDISCHDGKLLSLFQKKGAATIGIGPNCEFSNVEKKSFVVFNGKVSKYMVEAIASSYENVDFITATSYVDNIDEVFSLLKKIIVSETVVVIENHYLGPVLNEGQFDIFYGEFPRTYRYASILQIARICEATFIDVEFPAHFGGNIRVFLWNEASSSIVGKSIGTTDYSLRFY